MARSGRRREWARATDDTDVSSPVVDDDAESGDEEDAPEPAASDKSTAIRARAKRFGQAVVDRLAQLGVAIVAGVALCTSFPPFGWWFMAIAAFGLLAWVLTRETTTRSGGFGYGFLFGLAFYLPLLPWISGLVGAFPWFVLSVVAGAVPRSVRVGRRRGTAGCPAGRSGSPRCGPLRNGSSRTVPFGGFPWGVVGFSQTNGPLLPTRPVRRCAAAFVRGRAGRIRPGRDGFRDRQVVASHDDAVTPQPARGCAARGLHQRSCCWAPRWRARPRPAFRCRAQAMSRRSPSLPCRATCRGSGWSSTPNAGPCSTTTSARRCGWPTTCARAGAAAAVRHLAGELLRHRSARQPGRRATRSRPPPRPSTRRSWSAASSPPRLQPATTRYRRTRSSSGIPEPARPTATTSRSSSRSANTCRGAASSATCRQYADRAGYFVPGTGNGVVNAAGVPVGVTTCWEVIFDRAARESVQNGAQLLAVPANNATFNKAMSEQQLAFAQAARRRARPICRGCGHHGDQRGHRARRSRAGPHRVLRTRLPRHAGPAEDAAHARDAVGSGHPGPAGRPRRCGCDRRNTAQWKFRASSLGRRGNDKGAT